MIHYKKAVTALLIIGSLVFASHSGTLAKENSPKDSPTFLQETRAMKRKVFSGVNVLQASAIAHTAVRSYDYSRFVVYGTTRWATVPLNPEVLGYFLSSALIYWFVAIQLSMFIWSAIFVFCKRIFSPIVAPVKPQQANGKDTQVLAIAIISILAFTLCVLVIRIT